MLWTMAVILIPESRHMRRRMMTPKLRNGLIVLATVAVAFGGGAAWQFTQARQARQALESARAERAVIQRESTMNQLEATLALATVAAQFGNFERGRQLASDFFDLLQDRAVTAPNAARSGLNQILARRDHIITVLSRRQPEAGFELATALTSLQGALDREPTLPADQPSGPVEPGRE